MARQTEEQKLMRTWWMHFLLAVIFLGLSYGFLSLAIDSAHLWEYVLGLIFLIWALRYLFFGFRHMFSR